MKGCDHDVIYSGQTNLERKFAYICRTCGECGWDTRYVMALVDFHEFCRQRVRHGWATPPYLRNRHTTEQLYDENSVKRAALRRQQWLMLGAQSFFVLGITALCLWHGQWWTLALAATPTAFALRAAYRLWRGRRFRWHRV